MKPQVNLNKISTILKNLAIEAKSYEDVSFLEIMEMLQQYGFSLLMTMFCIPCVLPLPGISFVGGIPIIYFSIQILLGFDTPKIPNWIGKKKIKSQLLINIINKFLPYLEKFESFFKMKFLINNIVFLTKIIGFFSLLFAIYITLPLPFGNSLPSIGIILMNIGLLERNLLTVIIGVIIGMMGVILASGFMIGIINLLKLVIVKFYNFL